MCGVCVPEWRAGVGGRGAVVSNPDLRSLPAAHPRRIFMRTCRGRCRAWVVSNPRLQSRQGSRSGATDGPPLIGLPDAVSVLSLLTRWCVGHEADELNLARRSAIDWASTERRMCHDAGPLPTRRERLNFPWERPAHCIRCVRRP